ncbi:hypothetical protein BDR05DRAFT_113668 [Suillus weaverae]|nr:hypothetical protein BDR05DRAFT_113668 [Suillus weaverae]
MERIYPNKSWRRDALAFISKLQYSVQLCTEPPSAIAPSATELTVLQHCLVNRKQIHTCPRFQRDGKGTKFEASYVISSIIKECLPYGSTEEPYHGYLLRHAR